MHTILGAGGVIGRELSTALHATTDRIRQVSRSPQRVHATDEAVAADLLDAEATARAVEGSTVVYLVAGLPYVAGEWEDQWPVVMRNVIDACARHGARLAFFDNVYAYGAVDGVMTEATPFAPTSRKGEVRARIATTLLDAMAAGTVTALIARSADFYGPYAILSMTHPTVIERVHAGQKPQWLGDPSKVHTFTFTPDAGTALAALGQSDDAWGQTWHLPTRPERITGEAFARMACEAAGRPFDGVQAVPRWMLRAMGLASPQMRELGEMMYQFERDYVFDSSKIEAAYGLAATPYERGVEAALRALPHR